MKKISVIIPVYNMEEHLKRCVDSVLVQTYKNLEIILVDDGSTDSSPKICDEYAAKDTRVKVIHKENGGLSSARNAGLNIASGDYIGFVDSDDYISPQMYEILLGGMSDIGLTISNIVAVRFDDSGSIIDKRSEYAGKVLHTEEYARDLMLHRGDVSACTKLFSREIIGNVRFCEGVLNEDLLFMLEILPQVEKINYIRHIGYFYYVRQGSLSQKFGKTFIDMVSNSLIAQSTVNKLYPSLKSETFRFVMYQHMAYALAIPPEDATKDNDFYKKAIALLRRNSLRALFNKYLTFKNKVVIILLAISPKAAASLAQNKRRHQK